VVRLAWLKRELDRLGARHARKIRAFEARNKLGQLLDRVEAGEEIIITPRGRVVARLIPPRHTVDPDQARNAAAAIRAMSKGVTLGRLKPKDLVTEGRL